MGFDFEGYEQLKTDYQRPQNQCAQEALEKFLKQAVAPGISETLLVGYPYGYPDFLEEMNAATEFLQRPTIAGLSPTCLQDARADATSIVIDPIYWPWRKNSFQQILLLHSLEFMVDPEAILNEVWRVLKPGGYVTLAVQNTGLAALYTDFAGKGQTAWDLRQWVTTPLWEVVMFEHIYPTVETVGTSFMTPFRVLMTQLMYYFPVFWGIKLRKRMHPNACHHTGAPPSKEKQAVPSFYTTQQSRAPHEASGE